MAITRSIEEICGQLSVLVPTAIAGLEGFCGSGKTTLADQLGERAPINVFHVDSFVRKFDEPPAYTECVDVERLRDALEKRDKSRPSLVEGICLRDVLSRVGIDTTTFLYLKRIGENGVWYDGLHLEAFEAGQPIPGDTEEPHRSDLEYHARVRPHEKAELIYERVVDD